MNFELLSFFLALKILPFDSRWEIFSKFKSENEIRLVAMVREPSTDFLFLASHNEIFRIFKNP